MRIFLTLSLICSLVSSSAHGNRQDEDVDSETIQTKRPRGGDNQPSQTKKKSRSAFSKVKSKVKSKEKSQEGFPSSSSHKQGSEPGEEDAKPFQSVEENSLKLFFQSDDPEQAPWLPEIGRHIVNYLRDPNDLANLALSCKGGHFLATWNRAVRDIRKLKDRTWVDGPLPDAVEAYRLNMAVMYMVKRVIIANERRSEASAKSFDQLVHSLQEVMGFLDQDSIKFSVTPKLLKFFRGVSSYLVERKNLLSLRDVGIVPGENSDSMEWELGRLYEYLSQGSNYVPSASHYPDKEDDIQKMSFVKRNALASVIKERTHDEDDMDILEVWFEFFRYSFAYKRSDVQEVIEIIRPDDEVEGNRNIEADYYNKLVTEFSSDLSVEDIGWAACAQYEVENYDQAEKLFETYLTKAYQDKIQLNPNFLCKAAELYLAIQKFDRANQLADMALERFRQETFSIESEELFYAYINLKDYSQAAKILEVTLSENRRIQSGWGTKVQNFLNSPKINMSDLRDLMSACLKSNKYNLLCELSEFLFEKYSNNYTPSDLGNAANAYFQMGNYGRSAQLLELLFEKYSNNYTPLDLSNAIKTNFKMGNYDRSAQLFEFFLENLQSKITASDLRTAIQSYLNLGKNDRAVSLYEQLFGKFPDEATPEDHRSHEMAQALVCPGSVEYTSYWEESTPDSSDKFITWETQ